MATLNRIGSFNATVPGNLGLSPPSISDGLKNDSSLSGPMDRIPIKSAGGTVISDNARSSSAGRVKTASRREVFKFQTDWLISSVAWSNEVEVPLQLAMTSYIEDYKNYLQVVRLEKDENDQEIYSIASVEHPYPATKVLWIPRSSIYTGCEQQSSVARLFATTADYLRIWRLQESFRTSFPADRYINFTLKNTDSQKQEQEIKLECLLNCNQVSNLCAPLTSFDWNDIDRRLIVTSSVDTTCAIWDLETSTIVSASPQSDKSTKPGYMRTQLVAHDQQVNDVSFSRSGTGRDVFVSVSVDNSLRLFDLRQLSTSTVLYDGNHGSSHPFGGEALVRVSCSKQDCNLLSTFAMDSNKLLIFDLRSPGQPVNCLSSHLGTLNSMSWAPHLQNHLCSAGNDCQALIWKLPTEPQPAGCIEEPLLAYRAGGKINSISWSSSHTDWIAIGHGNNLELLRV